MPVRHLGDENFQLAQQRMIEPVNPLLQPQALRTTEQQREWFACRSFMLVAEHSGGMQCQSHSLALKRLSNERGEHFTGQLIKRQHGGVDGVRGSTSVSRLENPPGRVLCSATVFQEVSRSTPRASIRGAPGAWVAIARRGAFKRLLNRLPRLAAISSFHSPGPQAEETVTLNIHTASSDEAAFNRTS